MPRYYFHLYNDVSARDEEGKVLPDLEAARANGIKEAREIMLDNVTEGRIDLSHRIDIADPTGEVLASVTFGDALQIES